MGVARIFQRGGHTDSYRGYSSDCHLDIVSCLLTRRLTKGGSRAPQDPPGYAYDFDIYYSSIDCYAFHEVRPFINTVDKQFV